MLNQHDGGSNMQGKQTNVTRVMLEKIFKYGLSSIVFTIALALGLIAINYVVAIKAPSFDVTKNKTNTLSRQTKKLLDEIDFEVKIIAFYATPQQRRASLILDKYANENDNISIELIDPIKKPILAEKYDVKYPRTIVFEAGTKTTRINPPTTRRQRHGEREITIALYRLQTDQSKTVYFSTGHGERSVLNAKNSGLSAVKRRLDEQNYIVETVNLLETGRVPEDCSLLIIAGPSISFLEEEEDMIKKYLDDEGSCIIMVDPGIETKLDRLAGSYGLRYGNDYIYETSRKLTTMQGGPHFPLCEPADDSIITSSLQDMTFMFPYVRSINSVMVPTGITHIKLITSSKDSWAETDMESVRKLDVGQKPVRDEGEQKGPIPVAIVTEREFMLPDSLATRDNYTFQVRSAFFGNARFVSNEFITAFQSNLSLFLNTVNWITRNERIIEVTPNTRVFTPVELRQSEKRMLNWLTLVIFPATLLSVGLFIWYRRR